MRTTLSQNLLLIAALSTTTVSAQDLVAYWPLNDGPVGAEVTIADDVIDAGLSFTDAAAEGAGGTWVDDPVRGTVFSTTEDDRLVAGTQGIDLAVGFTWSLWVKVAASNLTDQGADVIIGSRNGTWNKLQPTGLQRWADIGGYNIADDTWHHVALTGTDEPRVSLYIDGVLIGSDTTLWENLTAIDDEFEFGGSDRFSEDITGLMSDIAVWNGALSATAIADLAAGGPVQGGVDFEITEIDYSPTAGTVALTWESRENAEYAVRFSTDLINWDADLDDAVLADPGTTTTRSFDLTGAGIGNEPHVYFRVEEL